MIKENYFSTILTIGPRQAFEQALAELDVHPRTLVVGQDADEHIVEALESEGAGICIVALDRYGYHGPEAAITSLEVLVALQRYLNQEIIIVGSIENEHAILEAFLPQEENSIYYVLSGEQALQQRVIAALHPQGKRPIFIPAPYNTFDNFLAMLASMLIPDSPGLPPRPHPQTPTLFTPGKLPSSPRPYSRTPILSTPGKRKTKPKADLLLVTVTEVETKAILDLVAEKQIAHLHRRAYHDLGTIGTARTFLVQVPQMGYGGSGGSLKTIEAAIEALSPWAVIMVGIAFGFDPASQRIGDILVSQSIQNYDLERIGPAKYPRGNRVSASALLLSNFITSHHYLFVDWPDPPKILPGLILSGSKLVDDEDFRNQLRTIAPNAVGGEMEGVGLLEAAANKHVEWLLVKAISDWADGKKHENKKEYQQLAAENAARFTHKTIKLGDFARLR